MQDTFKHCPRCGSSAFEPRDEKLRVCAHCGHHLYLNPTVAVAAVLADETGRVLFIRRANEPSKGKLAFPGGFVDLRETAETALRREVREEVNLELQAIEYLSSHPNAYRYRDVTYPVLDLFFLASVERWENARVLEEVDSLCLHRPEEVVPAELAFDSMRQAWECYLARLRGSRSSSSTTTEAVNAPRNAAP